MYKHKGIFMRKFLFLAIGIFFANYANTDAENATKNIKQTVRGIQAHVECIEYIENTIKIGRLINAGQYKQVIKMLNLNPVKFNEEAKKHLILEQYVHKVLDELARAEDQMERMQFHIKYFIWHEYKEKDINAAEKDLLNLLAEQHNKLNEKAKSLAKIIETYTQAQKQR